MAMDADIEALGRMGYSVWMGSLPFVFSSLCLALYFLPHPVAVAWLVLLVRFARALTCIPACICIGQSVCDLLCTSLLWSCSAACAWRPTSCRTLWPSPGWCCWCAVLLYMHTCLCACVCVL